MNIEAGREFTGQSTGSSVSGLRWQFVEDFAALDAPEWIAAGGSFPGIGFDPEEDDGPWYTSIIVSKR